MIKHDIDTWKISLEDFEKGGWGSASIKFKVPRMVAKRFTEKILNGHIFESDVIHNDKYKVEDLKYNQIRFLSADVKLYRYQWDRATQTQKDGKWVFYEDLKTVDEAFNVKRCFKEFATTHIQTIKANASVLDITEFYQLETDTKINLRYGIYNAIQFTALNKQSWERVTNSNITTPNFSMNDEATPWAIDENTVGRKAWQYFINSGIWNYEWRYPKDVKFMETKNGNIKIIDTMNLEEYLKRV